VSSVGVSERQVSGIKFFQGNTAHCPSRVHTFAQKRYSHTFTGALTVLAMLVICIIAGRILQEM